MFQPHPLPEDFRCQLPDMKLVREAALRSEFIKLLSRRTDIKIQDLLSNCYGAGPVPGLSQKTRPSFEPVFRWLSEQGIEGAFNMHVPCALLGFRKVVWAQAANEIPALQWLASKAGLGYAEGSFQSIPESEANEPPNLQAIVFTPETEQAALLLITQQASLYEYEKGLLLGYPEPQVRSWVEQGIASGYYPEEELRIGASRLHKLLGYQSASDLYLNASSGYHRVVEGLDWSMFAQRYTDTFSFPSYPTYEATGIVE